MPSTINATPTSSGLISSADASGVLELQSGGVTKATISSSGLAIGQYNPSSSLVSSGTAVASTSGTSIDFTSIPSYVKRITVMFNGVSTNSTSFPLIQIGSGSVSTTGYVSASGRTNSANNAAMATSTSGFVIMNAAASDAIRGAVVLNLLGSNTWVASGVLTDSGTLISMTVGGTSPVLGGALDRVRITTVNGTDTFDAGSINILFE